MPEITLEVLTLDSNPLPERHCLFTGVGGTIGRDEGNTLVLQDKHRRVSRLHASITFPEDLPTITNASSSLPVTVSTSVLSYGQKTQLSAGDLIEIGPFVLRVRASASPDTDNAILAHEQPTILAPAVKLPPVLRSSAASTAPAISMAPVIGDVDPFADLFADMAPLARQTESCSEPVLRSNVVQTPPVSVPASIEPDPFADLLGFGLTPIATALPPGPTTGEDPFSGYPQRVQPSDSDYRRPDLLPDRSPAAIIPEDFNPFELPSQTSRNAADPLAQMLGGASQAASVISGEPSIDALFSSSASSPFGGLTDGALTDSLYPGQGMNSLASPPESNDPMMMFDGSGSMAEMPARSPARDDLAEVGSAYQPPRAYTPGTPTLFQSQQISHFPISSDAGFGASPDALTAAFLKGTGLSPNALPGGLTPEIMSVIGSLLRTATAGAIDMLAARAATKLEVQANVTIISAQSNNPLKFLPNAESALQQMLGKRMPGFMRADEAMRDAFDDLRAHEIGVIAGTRAALTEILGRFDPSLLEKCLAGGTLIDSLLPAIRKTKLWEIYLEQYAKIRREAEDDFQSVFGRSFLTAYEQETARVKAHTSESGKK
jgi:FHA domain-containing protein